jgi:hypothetical protein
LALAALSGCVERTIRVTSEPPGAIVWLNNVEVGRTPVETDFTFYGEYDVRLNREGFEPIVTTRDANAPIHEWPGLDLVAAALPFTFSNTVKWHFDMAPTPESIDPTQAQADLLQRAGEARDRYAAPPPAAVPSAGPPDER